MKLIVGGSAVAYHDPTLSVLSAIPLLCPYLTFTRWSEGVVIGDLVDAFSAGISPVLKTSPPSFKRRGRHRQQALRHDTRRAARLITVGVVSRPFKRLWKTAE